MGGFSSPFSPSVEFCRTRGVSEAGLSDWGAQDLDRFQPLPGRLSGLSRQRVMAPAVQARRGRFWVSRRCFCDWGALEPCPVPAQLLDAGQKLQKIAIWLQALSCGEAWLPHALNAPKGEGGLSSPLSAAVEFCTTRGEAPFQKGLSDWGPRTLTSSGHSWTGRKAIPTRAVWPARRSRFGALEGPQGLGGPELLTRNASS